MNVSLKTLLRALEEHGILLESDPVLPSVSTLVAGEAVRGSWWAHPSGRAIYSAAQALDDHPAVLRVKLINGKVGYLHRDHWGALLAVGRAREDWQLALLGDAARALLDRLDRASPLRPERVAGGPHPREAIQQIERSLLALVRSVHTDRGRHVRELVAWECWGREQGIGRPPPLAEAKEALGELAEGLEAQTGARARLPFS